MTTKIVKINTCHQCPHCLFDSEWEDRVFWEKYFCIKLQRIINPEKDIPYDCPLENAGL